MRLEAHRITLAITWQGCRQLNPFSQFGKRCVAFSGQFREITQCKKHLLPQALRHFLAWAPQPQRLTSTLAEASRTVPFSLRSIRGPAFTSVRTAAMAGVPAIAI